MGRKVPNPISPTGVEIEVDDDINDDKLLELLAADADEVESADETEYEEGVED